MHKRTIDIENDGDFELMKGLALRLGLPTIEWRKEDALAKQKTDFEALFGSWQGEESGDELAAMIHIGRK